MKYLKMQENMNKYKIVRDRDSTVAKIKFLI